MVMVSMYGAWVCQYITKGDNSPYEMLYEHVRWPHELNAFSQNIYFCPSDFMKIFIFFLWYMENFLKIMTDSMSNKRQHYGREVFSQPPAIKKMFSLLNVICKDYYFKSH